MKMLMLAPQPFFEPRGTPIAVDMILKVLCERGDRIDLVTYHEGRDVAYYNVKVHRIAKVPFVRGVPPGISWKKAVCDMFLVVKAMRLAFGGRYQLVHAVEEAVLIALLLKWLFRIPYVYDMDSSFAMQIIEKYPLLAPLKSPLSFLEKLAVRNAKAVVPVCDSLASLIERHGPEKVVVLRDVSLLKEGSRRSHRIRADRGIGGVLLMYVGNLESYQGIDLLLESFALAIRAGDQADLVIVGGKDADIQKYRAKAGHLGIGQMVHFLGPRPVEDLAGYLSEGDILVSPRTKGINTPMKLYSYLHSGKAVLATDLPTHTQVLDENVAVLAQPTPEAFSQAISGLVADARLRSRLGDAGKRLVDEQHTFGAFRKTLNGLYDWLAEMVNGEGGERTTRRSLVRRQ